jgi:hypothetical protein
VQDWNSETDTSRDLLDELLQQTNKRLTLNLLIQGAAAHAFLTAQHLVKEELETIRPGLTRLYDKFAVAFHLNYWIGDIPIVYGRPSKFWRRTHHPTHPFHRHRLLAERGRDLARAAKRNLTSRAWKKWVCAIPVLHYAQFMWLLVRVALAERRRRPQLSRLAVQTVAEIWNIDEDRLDAEFTTNVAFGNLPTPKTRVGRFTQQAAIGYGGVEQRFGQFQVVAKSWNWPLVVHELVKGTAELVCLHGLNTLDEEMYARVTDEADQIEYETSMLQVGPEIWRRLLLVLPVDRPLAEMLMHVARLDPQPLEELMFAVIDDPEQARQMLRQLP